MRRLKARVGDWVEIRTVAEILATLDERGECARMPFMPEMLRYAGQRFQVSAVAHKTCDTVNKTGGRKVEDAVHVADLRCSGAAHGNCQAECLLFWKTAWLRPVASPAVGAAGGSQTTGADMDTPPVLRKNSASRRDDGVEVYRCQATTLPEWSRPLPWWWPGQYWIDVRTGNVSWWHAVSTLLLAGIHKLRRLPVAYRFNCWLYRQAHLVLRGRPEPHPDPQIPRNGPTPVGELGLKVGELVEVRSLQDINATINQTHRNRGLFIGADDTRYCGHRARVTSRVTQIINEKTGEMMHFKNPCIVLENVNCLGEYSDGRLLCPRRIRTYWREVWLKRLSEGPRRP